jgi:uncharacterized protein YqgV (UPF0045/DUF77 family)
VKELQVQIKIEMSLYPLTEAYIPVIQGFIDQLNAVPGLHVETNTMSTQVSGDYDLVFATLQRELKAVYAAGGKAVLVTKFLGPM